MEGEYKITVIFFWSLIILLVLWVINQFRIADADEYAEKQNNIRK